MDERQEDRRFFVSYSGSKLPVRLVSPISADALANRNTFIRAYYDEKGLLRRFEKLVYGEVELSHAYEYHPSGALKQARVVMLDEEPSVLCFDERPEGLER